MALDMFNSTGICEAIRLACQSKVKLTANCTASDTVTVGWTDRFRPNTGGVVYPITGLSIAAELLDSDTDAEPVTISEITDEYTFTLSAACTGTFTTAKKATIGLVTPTVTLGSTASVTDSYVKFKSAINENQFPAIAVFELGGTQAGFTTKQYKQLRTFQILLCRRDAIAEESQQELEDDIQALANSLMEDYRLAGTVRNCWVSAWDMVPPEDPEFDGFSVGGVTLMTETIAQWQK